MASNLSSEDRAFSSLSGMGDASYQIQKKLCQLQQASLNLAVSADELKLPGHCSCFPTLSRCCLLSISLLTSLGVGA